MEERLTGGNTNSEVVRVGMTVRRRTGPWTPSVHSLLRHLEASGFDGAPRLLGIDDQGREILTFVEGVVVWPDHLDVVGDDRTLAEVATLIRRYHDTVADFETVASQEWSDLARDPTQVGEVVCHNDLAPWNLVLGVDGWKFIDWDLAAPGRRSWDLGWALATLVPLMSNSKLTTQHTQHRIRAFRDGYGADVFPEDVLRVAAERCGNEARVVRDLGSAGREPFVRLLAEGHADHWATSEQHIRRMTPTWQSAIAQSI